ncbi:interleukin-34 isoform X3 [Tyto alba]|uniref:interleukin-34 isoform X3 n=1 Tax=Tyto alba TaxID=56313 RepID=UPI001402D937|nr:interleukin-34 isoform X3 [Tyto alba]
MQQSYAAVLCVLAVLGLEAAAPGECELTRLLQDKLQYEMRLQYMKHYFPINYTVQVQYEEVLRPSNITRLRNGTVSEAALRYLWFHVSSQAVLRIREVLPEKHPSWKYTQELCQLFDALGKEYSKYRQRGTPVTPWWPVPADRRGGCGGRPGEAGLQRGCREPEEARPPQGAAGQLPQGRWEST